MTDIDEPLLPSALRKVEKRGAIETARRVRQRAERIFRYAKAAGAGDGNPASEVKEAMQLLPNRRRWPALAKLDELRELVVAARRKRYGLQTICEGGGLANVIIVEALH